MAFERGEKGTSKNDIGRENKHMNENRPYNGNDERWNGFSMPDVDASWQKMNDLLDKKEKRRLVPPFFFSYAGVALMVILCAGAIWFLFGPGGIYKNHVQATRIEKSKNIPGINSAETIVQKHTSIQKRNSHDSAAEGVKVKQVFVPQVKNEKSKSGSEEENVSFRNSKEKGHSKNSRINNASNNSLSAASSIIRRKNKINPGNQEPNVSVVTKANKDHNKSQVDTSFVAKTFSTPDNLIFTKDDKTKKVTTDTSKQIIEQSKTVSAANKKPAANKTNQFYISTGLGIQQQVRNGSQVSYPENYYGKPGFLSEHIPSVYLRLHKKEKWFLQAEFRFGTPQLVNDYHYAHGIKYDTRDSVLKTTSEKLKKLYYHQLPISFNYYLNPHLSVGAGAVYSIFYRAITERSVTSKSIVSGAETNAVSVNRVPAYSDSFFFKSQIQAIIQADYQWKKLSLGLRFKKDLQPYIRYMNPDGTIDEKMNNALEVILRYRFFKSGSKK
jgi:hypothetical protein